MLWWAVQSGIACAAVPSSEPVRIGILAPEGRVEAVREWHPLAAYLARALPDHRFVLRYFNLNELRQAVASGQLDFAVTNSGQYVDFEAAYGLHRIATLDNARFRSPDRAIASAVVVSADRADLVRLADLHGKRVLAVDEHAFGGYQLAWLAMQRQGIDPERDLAALRFTGFPLQAIVRDVAAGRADAGIVRACVIEDMAARGEIRLSDFRVLDAPAHDTYPCLRSTAAYPDWPFAALRGADRALSKRVASALLAMPRAADGLSWTVAADYQPVQEAFRELRIGPYAHLRQGMWTELFNRYRRWLYIAGAVLVAWLVHTIRVEQRVHARTRELREALENSARMEREARIQQEKLDHLARLGILGELSSMVAHELNQPLSAIGNFARGMERRIEAGRLEPEPLLDASREVAEQADRAREIMHRIRSFTRKRGNRRERILLHEAIDSAVSLFQGIGERAPKVERHVVAGAEVLADRLQIEQVLLNLLKNGMDAMQETPPAERILVVDCRRDPDTYRICVADRGCGLDADGRAHLFEPFFTTKPDGMGLGLSLCKTIVEAHGGRLWVEPGADGRGLTVCFSLPVAETDP